MEFTRALIIFVLGICIWILPEVLSDVFSVHLSFVKNFLLYIAGLFMFCRGFGSLIAMAIQEGFEELETIARGTKTKPNNKESKGDGE